MRKILLGRPFRKRPQPLQEKLRLSVNKLRQEVVTRNAPRGEVISAKRWISYHRKDHHTTTLKDL